MSSMFSTSGSWYWRIPPPQPLPLRQAHVCQQLVLFNTITGKLHESWVAIRKGYFSSKLSVSLDSSLPSEASDGLRNLKQYFGRNTNLVERVRNNFAFHYSIVHASKPIPDDTSTEELVAYLADPIGHSLFQFAESAVTRALLETVDPADPEGAFDLLFLETQDVVRWFNDFAHGLMIVILERHGLLDPGKVPLVPVQLTNVPSQADLNLAYFFDLPGDASPVPEDA